MSFFVVFFYGIGYARKRSVLLHNVWVIDVYITIDKVKSDTYCSGLCQYFRWDSIYCVLDLSCRNLLKFIFKNARFNTILLIRLLLCRSGCEFHPVSMSVSFFYYFLTDLLIGFHIIPFLLDIHTLCEIDLANVGNLS